MSLLGPEGVRQRMSELQARMDIVRPNLAPPATPPSSTSSKTGFNNALKGLMNPMEGTLPGRGEIGPVNPAELQIDKTASSADFREIAAKIAVRYGLDPVLYQELVNYESGFNPNARSKAGAVGLAQLIPDSAAELGVTDRTDPIQSLNAGARYLRRMMDRFGDPRLALAAYNAGPGTVQKSGGVPNIAETQSYVSGIMSSTMARKNG